MEQVLFSVSTVHGLNKRFPNFDKMSVFDGSDLVPEMTNLVLTKEYTSPRSGSVVFGALLNDKPCLVRRIDVTQNVETQTDTLVYLSLLKTLRHNQLEQVTHISVSETGAGRIKETKLIVVSETGSDFVPLSSFIDIKPSNISDWSMRVKLALDIARGIEALHNKNIVHGDIKTVNIFARRNSDWQGKLMSYFKCQQRGSSGTAEPSEDILAFGILMAEMALGDDVKLIFGAPDKSDKISAVSKTTGINETKLRKLFPFLCPESFEVLICECCREDAPRRPNISTCVESLLEILEELSDSSHVGGASVTLSTILPIYKPQSSPIKKQNPLANGESPEQVLYSRAMQDGMDKYSGPEHPSSIAIDTSPAPALQSRIALLEQELENLKREALVNGQLQAVQQQPSVTPALTENILGTILTKINAIEDRLGGESQKSSRLDMKSTPDKAEGEKLLDVPPLPVITKSIIDGESNKDLQCSKSVQDVPIQPFDTALSLKPLDTAVTDVQLQLEEFSAIVDQAIETRSKIKDTLSRSGEASPIQKEQIASASNELSIVLDSFMDVINKCSFLSSRADDVLNSMDQHGNISSAPYSRSRMSNRSRSPGSPVFNTSFGNTSQNSIVSRSRSCSPHNSGSSKHFAVFSFSKSPRFAATERSDMETLDSFREAMSRSESSIPFFDKSRRSRSPLQHSSVPVNTGSSLPKSYGEGIGIKPTPLPKGWWRETGKVYKGAGWKLRPTSDTRLGSKMKSVGSPGTPHLCQSDSKLLNNFYRADPRHILQERKEELKKGVYRPDVPYRHQKTGAFFATCNGPEISPKSSAGKSNPEPLRNFL